jgi:hypothetical protein
MKKIILPLITAFLFSCSQENKPSTLTIATPIQSTVTPQPVTVTDDSVLEEKVRKAFALLQTYAKTSKVLPRNFSQTYILPITGVTFGIVEPGKNGTTHMVTKKRILHGELPIYFEDVLIGSSDHVAQTISGTVDISTLSKTDTIAPAAITILREYVRTKSIALIASVLLHELVHFGLRAEGSYQSPDPKSTVHCRNEFQAYLMQTNFLVYAYNGPEKEYEYVSQPNNKRYFATNDLDKSEFLHFVKMRDEMYSKIPHNNR